MVQLFRGMFIVRQDVDDISLPYRLRKLINFMEKNPGFAFCWTNGYRKQNSLKKVVLYTKFKDVKKNL